MFDNALYLRHYKMFIYTSDADCWSPKNYPRSFPSSDEKLYQTRPMCNLAAKCLQYYTEEVDELHH